MPPTVTELDRLRAALDLLNQSPPTARCWTACPSRSQAASSRGVQGPQTRQGERRRLLKRSKRGHKAAIIKNDEGVFADTGIRTLRAGPFSIRRISFLRRRLSERRARARRAGREAGREAIEPQYCYVCKQEYSAIHHFYDQLCPPCADFNFAKRTELADLRGPGGPSDRRAREDRLPGRLETAPFGAHLIVTTRFPRDPPPVMAREADFGDWSERLEIVGLDLARHHVR